VFCISQIALALAYAVLWNLTICLVDSLLMGRNVFTQYWHSSVIGWQLFMGATIFGVVAGFGYTIQTRNRLHEKELAVSRAEALAAAAQLDAIRARLHPHFLFNALHTLAALSKLQPAICESAFDRLGQMLRYALRNESRKVVEFEEEYDFARQYLSFEQLRYGERLSVHYKIDEHSYDFEIPVFSLQTLAENAVRHAISTRPEGGTIWIQTSFAADALSVSVRDDGPGATISPVESHHLGLRSLRERLELLYGECATLTTRNSSSGFEARFVVPSHLCDIFENSRSL
jgi:LytS/YehU family sensor histidine kinase